jgi:hypothetical protein
MVLVTLSGEIISEVQMSFTLTGASRATCVVECYEADSLPMRHSLAFFGKAAERARALTRGTRILASGRLSAGGVSRKVSLSVASFEVLQDAASEHAGAATAVAAE